MTRNEIDQLIQELSERRIRNKGKQDCDVGLSTEETAALVGSFMTGLLEAIMSADY